MVRRSGWKYVAVAALMAAAVWYGVDQPGSGRRAGADLATAIAPEADKGWRVARPPDAAGPYRRDGQPTVIPPGGVGAVTYRTPGGPVTVRLPARPDAHQMAVPLQTADGFATLVVLERPVRGEAKP